MVHWAQHTSQGRHAGQRRGEAQGPWLCWGEPRGRAAAGKASLTARSSPSTEWSRRKGEQAGRVRCCSRTRARIHAHAHRCARGRGHRCCCCRAPWEPCRGHRRRGAGQKSRQGPRHGRRPPQACTAVVRRSDAEELLTPADSPCFPPSSPRMPPASLPSPDAGTRAQRRLPPSPPASLRRCGPCPGQLSIFSSFILVFITNHYTVNSSDMFISYASNRIYNTFHTTLFLAFCPF